MYLTGIEQVQTIILLLWAHVFKMDGRGFPILLGSHYANIMFFDLFFVFLIMYV